MKPPQRIDVYRCSGWGGGGRLAEKLDGEQTNSLSFPLTFLKTNFVSFLSVFRSLGCMGHSFPEGFRARCFFHFARFSQSSNLLKKKNVEASLFVLG